MHNKEKSLYLHCKQQAINKYSKIMDKTFTEWWESLTPEEKDSVAIDLSDKCNTALSTVRFWGYGYRTPKSRSQEIIVNYLKSSKKINTDRQTLFPN